MLGSIGCYGMRVLGAASSYPGFHVARIAREIVSGENARTSRKTTLWIQSFITEAVGLNIKGNLALMLTSSSIKFVEETARGSLTPMCALGTKMLCCLTVPLRPIPKTSRKKR